MVILTKNLGNLNFPHFFGTLFTWQKRAGNYKHTLFNFPSYKFKIDTFWRENSNISKSTKQYFCASFPCILWFSTFELELHAYHLRIPAHFLLQQQLLYLSS